MFDLMSGAGIFLLVQDIEVKFAGSHLPLYVVYIVSCYRLFSLFSSCSEHLYQRGAGSTERPQSTLTQPAMLTGINSGFIQDPKSSAGGTSFATASFHTLYSS